MPLFSRLRQRLRQAPGFRTLRLLRQRQFGQTSEDRESARLQLSPPTNLFQPSGFTEGARYPVIFSFLRDQLQGQATPVRLLSFGCSTGQELAALDQRFPDSLLTGIEISAPRLAEAADRLRPLLDQGRLRLIQGSSAASLPPDLPPFDAVLAMAVFRHHDLNSRPPHCHHILRFSAFADTVSGLAERIRPGGFLCLIHSNFDFMETAAAADFHPCVSAAHPPETPRYGADDALRPTPELDMVVFRRKTPEDRTGPGVPPIPLRSKPPETA